MWNIEIFMAVLVFWISVLGFVWLMCSVKDYGMTSQKFGTMIWCGGLMYLMIARIIYREGNIYDMETITVCGEFFMALLMLGGFIWVLLRIKKHGLTPVKAGLLVFSIGMFMMVLSNWHTALIVTF